VSSKRNAVLTESFGQNSRDALNVLQVVARDPKTDQILCARENVRE
jgi:hypothetical protein